MNNMIIPVKKFTMWQEQSPDNQNKKTADFIEKLFDILILISSLAIVTIISIETLNKLPETLLELFMKIQLWVCVIFMSDFIFRLSRSKNRWSYLKHRWLFFLVSIPIVNIVQWFNVSTPEQMSILLRLIPLLRGAYGLIFLVGWLTRNTVTNLVISYIIIMAAMIWFSAIIFYKFEFQVNTQVTQFKDAFWWALMNATTVGSTIIAVTTVGKILTVCLAVSGLMMFPIFTVYINTKLQQRIIGKKPEITANGPNNPTQ